MVRPTNDVTQNTDKTQVNTQATTHQIAFNHVVSSCATFLEKMKFLLEKTAQLPYQHDRRFIVLYTNMAALTSCETIYSFCNIKILACKAGVFSRAIHNFFFGNNAIPPSCTLKLPESWGESKPDFKGELLFLLFKTAAAINVPQCFH